MWHTSLPILLLQVLCCVLKSPCSPAQHLLPTVSRNPFCPSPVPVTGGQPVGEDFTPGRGKRGLQALPNMYMGWCFLGTAGVGVGIVTGTVSYQKLVQESLKSQNLCSLTTKLQGLHMSKSPAGGLLVSVPLVPSVHDAPDLPTPPPVQSPCHSCLLSPVYLSSLLFHHTPPGLAFLLPNSSPESWMTTMGSVSPPLMLQDLLWE